MICSAKNTTKKLLVEDSGIAMPISLLVFLFLTFVCMSVFALGEVIRARTELQYKVDNAAYAAALVQADSLSRIAVLNRALAWTYAQSNKLQIDYIANRWLSEARQAFVDDSDAAEAVHQSNCPKHKWNSDAKGNEHTNNRDVKADLYFLATNLDRDIITGKLLVVANLNLDDINPEQLGLHGFIGEAGQTAEALQNILDKTDTADGLYLSLWERRNTANKNMKDMATQITDIMNNMYPRMQTACHTVLKDSICLYGKRRTSNDSILEKFKKVSEIFEFYNNQVNKEDKIETEPWNTFFWQENGLMNEWKEPQWELSWSNYGVIWECDENGHKPILTDVNPKKRISKPGYFPYFKDEKPFPWSEEWKKSAELAVQKLKKEYFSADGSIVVAAKTSIPDLFGNVFGKNKFLNFRVDGNLWAVAAARAGYRNGEKYENSKFLNEDKWNLFKDDWEPMFLPVGRCWKSWDGEKFTGDDAYKVLKTVAENLDIYISENGLNLNEKVNLDVLH